MSADKYPSIFSRQMKAIVYIYIYFLVFGVFCSKNKYSMKGELPKSLIVYAYIRFQIFFQIFRLFYSYALFTKYKDQLKKYIKDQLNKLNHHFGQTTVTTTWYFILTSFLSLLM